MLKDKVREQRDKMAVMTDERELMGRQMAMKEEQMRILKDEYKLQMS